MKQNIKFSAVVLISLLLIMLPICFAQEINEGQKIKNEQQPIPASYYYNFPGLVSWIVTILFGAGFTYVAVGVAVIAGGYVVYRVGYSVWTYYTAYKYSRLIEYGHINEFKNIWKVPPSKKDFEKKCKDNMNSKSVERYIQVADGRSIAYNPSTGMLTVGDTNGKDIITCFPKPKSDVANEVKKGRWKKM